MTTKKSPNESFHSLTTTIASVYDKNISGSTIRFSDFNPSVLEFKIVKEIEEYAQYGQEFYKLGGHIADIEAQEAEEPALFPVPRSSWIRYVALSMYRRLFTLVFIGNLIAFIYVLVADQKLLNVVNAAVTNILGLGLARQPLVVNALFVIFGSVPRSAPFWIRKFCTKIYCYGGIHSGCGIAACIWYAGFIGLLTRQFILKNDDDSIKVTSAIITLSYLIFILLLCIIMAAHPKVRMKFHDHFELIHRFCGWAVMVIFWPLLMLFSKSAANAAGKSLGLFLVQFPTFWMIIVSTLAIIHPWLLLRRVAIQTDDLSKYATRLHFNHTAINFGQGLTLAKHPLKDWHSFATFPDIPSLPGISGTTKAAPDFSCLISKAGDWTTDTIEHSPTHLWKRGVPMYGFGYVMKVFHRIIVVTTGSGIGPCLSFLGDPQRPKMRVIWQTRTPEATYGQPIIDLVTLLDAEPHIIDTKLSGKRVDMLPLVMRMFKEFDAEAVCVISNPPTTKEVVFGCEARGIPAFGPIFDS